MNAPSMWSRILLIVGLAAMLIGLIDPMEGSFAVLVGTGLNSVAALMGRSQFRALIYSSLGLVAIGVAVMMALSMLGGVGGNAGLSMWWGLAIVPYPIGWVMGLIGALAALFEGKPLPNTAARS